MSFLYCLRVSSKFRTAGTTDNFEIAVNPPITTSQDCTAFVSQATIPVTWPTFRAGVNNQMLFAVQLGPGSPYQIQMISIEPGFYDGDSLAEYLQEELNGIFGSEAGLSQAPWTVALQGDGRFSISWGTPSNPGLQWCLLPKSVVGNFEPQVTDAPQVPEGYTGALANHTLGLFSEIPQIISQGQPLVCDGLYNALRTNSVYIHSNLSSFSSQGPAPGDRDVILKVGIDVPWGYQCHYQDSGNNLVRFPVGNQSFSKLTFRVTDSAGDSVDFQHQDCELEIWFYDQP